MIKLESLTESGEAALENIIANGVPPSEEPLATVLDVSGQPGPAPEVFQSVGDFKVSEVLSTPGSPLCLRATDEAGALDVVLKELTETDVRLRAACVQTQLSIAALDSTSIATPYGFSAADGRVYLVRQYVPGRSVAMILDTLRDEEVPPDSPTWRLAAGARGGGANVTGAKMVCRIGRFAAEALRDGHARGAIHGALKPENLICDDTVQPTVVDYGSGRPVPPYEAPEVIRAADRHTARSAPSDLYALGAVLHECLTRQPMFGGGDAGALEQATLSRKPVRPLKVNFKASREMETITLALLEKDPLKRYASAGELHADLKRYHRNEPILRKSPGLLKRIFG